MSVKTEGEQRQTPEWIFLCHFGTLVTVSKWRISRPSSFHQNLTMNQSAGGRSFAQMGESSPRFASLSPMACLLTR